MADVIHIPPDISRSILLLLPPKSLVRFRAVCTAWQAIIDDPSFVRAHTDTQPPSILLRCSKRPLFHTFDLETLKPIPASTPGRLSRLPLPLATCHGLMLVPPEERGQTWEMWNTLTQERLELELPQKSIASWLTVGLGYDCASDDYKAVAIVLRTNPRNEVFQTHVYSLKSDTWRRVCDFPWDWPLRERDRRLGPGAFLCGSLHWITERGHQIIAFDLGTESFNELKVKPPPGLRDRDRRLFKNREFQVDVMDGCLAVIDCGQDVDDSCGDHFDMWVMKEYGVEDSWTRLFKLPGYGLRPVACLKGKKEVVMHDRVRFYLFDVEKKSFKEVDIQQGFSGVLSAQVFRGSIYRLHDNCGVSDRDATDEGRRKRARTSSIHSM